MNIVFDLGGVVFTWNPKALAGRFFSDAKSQQVALEQIFRHKDWIELDRGTLDREDAIDRALQRTGLEKGKVAELIYGIAKELVPNPATVRLIQRIKNTNKHRLYVLSNMHPAVIEYFDQAYDFWPLFDGRVISCHIKMVKPEPQIYTYLLNQFDLNPSQTVFIDDMPVNLEAASKFGIKTILFKNPEQCERDLAAMGIL